MKKILKMKNNKGFSLVELIVILVVLAVLAGILVPALLGYIDRAKTEEDMLNAKNCMTAAQGELVAMYGSTKPAGTNNILFDTKSANNNNSDVEAAKSEFAKKVFTTADDHPYLFIIGMGNYNKYKESNPHYPYTVYLGMYQRTKDSRPLFFDGTNWDTLYPKDQGAYDGGNVLQVNKVKLQMYILADAGGRKATDNDIWNYMREQIKKFQ